MMDKFCELLIVIEKLSGFYLHKKAQNFYSVNIPIFTLNHAFENKNEIRKWAKRTDHPNHLL